MLRQAVRWEARATRYEQELAFGAPGSAKLPEPNPCRKLYGPGPKGARCAGCALLRSYAPGNRTYHKCELRVFTRSQRSDHRMRWLACAKFDAPRVAIPDPVFYEPFHPCTHADERLIALRQSVKLDECTTRASRTGTAAASASPISRMRERQHQIEPARHPHAAGQRAAGLEATSALLAACHGSACVACPDDAGADHRPHVRDNTLWPLGHDVGSGHCPSPACPRPLARAAWSTSCRADHSLELERAATAGAGFTTACARCCSTHDREGGQS